VRSFRLRNVGANRKRASAQSACCFDDLARRLLAFAVRIATSNPRPREIHGETAADSLGSPRDKRGLSH
jgi:hypothetical protein